MCIEFTGIMHSAYIIQNFMSAVSGKPIISNEEPKTGFTIAFYWGHILMSLAILEFCMVVVMVVLFNRDTMVTVKYPGILVGLSIFLFFFFMCVVGTLEAMQIAFFGAAKLTAAKCGNSFFGKKTCSILFDGNRWNFPGFMIGQQLTVVGSFFLVASITSLNIKLGEGNNIFGISNGAEQFLKYGFHGAVITTILASIMWQYAALAFLLVFLNSPITFDLLIFALVIEGTGICHGAWVTARVLKKVCKLQYNEVYVGTPEECMASSRPDKELNIAQDVDHLTGGGFMGHLCGSHDALDSPIRSKDAIDPQV
jgi:hypothetical protein